MSLEIKGKNVSINKSLYAYVGSAMKNLSQRVGRHLSYKEKEYKKHWHIDNILQNPKNEIIFVSLIPSFKRLEEDISIELSKKFRYIKYFGASDLKVESNLFIINNIDLFFDTIKPFIL